VAAGFDGQHQAGAHQAPVEGDAASAAVTGGATLLAAGQMQLVAQDIQQGLMGLAKKFDGITIDGRGYVKLRLRH
jgi:hypothetical protein